MLAFLFPFQQLGSDYITLSAINTHQVSLVAVSTGSISKEPPIGTKHVTHLSSFVCNTLKRCVLLQKPSIMVHLIYLWKKLQSIWFTRTGDQKFHESLPGTTTKKALNWFIQMVITDNCMIFQRDLKILLIFLHVSTYLNSAINYYCSHATS